MDKFDKANRIARHIFFHGIDSLSIAEESVLNHDREFCKAVDAILEKLRRTSYLENNRGYSLDIFGNHNELFKHIIWEHEEYEYHADVIKNSKSGRANIEIKRYFLEDYENTMNIGSHEAVTEKKFDSASDKDFQTGCIELLIKYGCPNEKIKKAFE